MHLSNDGRRIVIGRQVQSQQLQNSNNTHDGHIRLQYDISIYHHLDEQQNNDDDNDSWIIMGKQPNIIQHVFNISLFNDNPFLFE